MWFHPYIPRIDWKFQKCCTSTNQKSKIFPNPVSRVDNFLGNVPFPRTTGPDSDTTLYPTILTPAELQLTPAEPHVLIIQQQFKSLAIVLSQSLFITFHHGLIHFGTHSFFQLHTHTSHQLQPQRPQHRKLSVNNTILATNSTPHHNLPIRLRLCSSSATRRPHQCHLQPPPSKLQRRSTSRANIPVRPSLPFSKIDPKHAAISSKHLTS